MARKFHIIGSSEEEEGIPHSNCDGCLGAGGTANKRKKLYGRWAKAMAMASEKGKGIIWLPISVAIVQKGDSFHCEIAHSFLILAPEHEHVPKPLNRD
jgi:hypothetical protein